MADRTAARRVKRYRQAQSLERGIVRAEIQLPEPVAGPLKARGRALRAKFRAAQHAASTLELLLGTVNAPRPQTIDAPTLLACLLAPAPDAQWRAHVAAVFDEVSPDTLHDLVLAGVIEFEDLNRAARDWRIRDGRNLAWIAEMAELSLARPSARHAADPAGAPRQA